MQQLIKVLDYNGKAIQFEIINGQVFANATAMCQAFEKKPADWLRLPTTKKYMDALKAKWENLTLVETRQGGENPGTWIHEKLILKLAQWLSVEFELWCDEKMAELLRTGSVSIINPEQTPVQAIEAHTKRPVQIENAKGANKYSFQQGNKEACIDWNRKVAFHFTKMTPHELKEWAKKKGVPAKARTSGKEVIRQFRPEKAAGVSVADFFHSMGEDDETALKLGEMSIPLVNKLLQYNK